MNTDINTHTHIHTRVMGFAQRDSFLLILIVQRPFWQSLAPNWQDSLYSSTSFDALGALCVHESTTDTAPLNNKVYDIGAVSNVANNTYSTERNSQPKYTIISKAKSVITRTC